MIFAWGPPRDVRTSIFGVLCWKVTKYVSEKISVSYPTGGVIYGPIRIFTYIAGYPLAGSLLPYIGEKHEFAQK